jgi:predicted amidohydrolase
MDKSLSVVVAQFPISFSISHNLTCLQEVVATTCPNDLVVFPEGSVSGYSHDAAFLDQIDLAELDRAWVQLKREAAHRHIHVWLGACYAEQGHWFNAAWGFTPEGETHVYHKVNLATHERGRFTAGTDLPVFKLTTPGGVLSVGVQLCRELRYPEQWGWLARKGAQVLLHLNNAVDSTEGQAVWRSHLISRAAETQRFVISANNAHRAQRCPTLVISPSGQVLAEVVSSEAAALRVKLDLTQVSDWYLSQCRTDIVAVKHV